MNYSSQVPSPWTVFETTPIYAAGTNIEIIVTYVPSSSYSGYSNTISNPQPEVCIFTSSSFLLIVTSKPIDQQTQCSGPNAWNYNATTNVYTILFPMVVPESSTYVITSRLVASNPYSEYTLPTATLTISESSQMNPLQRYGDPSTVSMWLVIAAAVFGILAGIEHRQHHR